MNREWILIIGDKSARIFEWAPDSRQLKPIRTIRSIGRGLGYGFGRAGSHKTREESRAAPANRPRHRDQDAFITLFHLRIASFLRENEKKGRRFARLTVAASPTISGKLRNALKSENITTPVSWITKDLSKIPDHDLLLFLSPVGSPPKHTLAPT